MGRRFKDGIPGSIYADYGKLIIKVHGMKIHTGLSDNTDNRRHAEQLKKKLYLNLIGVDQDANAKTKTKTKTTFNEAFEMFVSKHCSNKALKTIVNYTGAFTAIVTNGKLPVTIENIENFACAFTKRTDIKEVSINIYLLRRTLLALIKNIYK